VPGAKHTRVCRILMACMRETPPPDCRLSGSCGLDATGKEALARIGNSAGLQELMSPFEILADAKLTHVLGTGGHATVFAGQQPEVAALLFLSRVSPCGPC
jgi:hypothetical protein